jgi:chaperonin GroEL
MRNKNIDFNTTAREKIKTGVNKLADAVKSTLGPCGQNVILEKEHGAPVVTKDGVSVAKEIQLKDPVENIGAQVIKEVSVKAAKQAGDGTTTATVLAAAMFNDGLKYMAAGHNAVEIKRGMDKAMVSVTKNLKELSKDVSNHDEIRQVATISANGDDSIGNIIAEAMEEVGKNGVITVEESKTAETTLEIVEGMQIDRGYLSPYFVTDNSKMIATLENPYILLYDKKISNIKEILPLLETCSKQSKSLLIIADDVDGEALATMVVNKARGILNICAIKAPGFGDRKTHMLEDLAILTGGTVVSTQKGMKLEKLTMEMLGTARNVTIEKDKTTIVDGSGNQDAIKKRFDELQEQHDNADSDYEKQAIKDRMNKLVGGVAIINIGAASEVELKEKKDRVDDALHATRAAVEEGIVAGGGMALIYATDENEWLEETFANHDQQLGARLVYDACKSPFMTICSNAGKNGEAVLMKLCTLTDENRGYDARNDEYVNMFEAGIIDPTKVTRTALEMAVSVAGTLLTTDCVVSLEPQKEEKQQPGYDY